MRYGSFRVFWGPSREKLTAGRETGKPEFLFSLNKTVSLTGRILRVAKVFGHNWISAYSRVLGTDFLVATLLPSNT